MKFHFLIPGTGNFFCGTCLRDHTLVRELCLQGHEVTVLEMYLPHVLEEVAHARGPLFFGGINCYLQPKFPISRKTPRFVDRLFDHRGLIRNAMKHEGMTDAHELAAMTVSMLRGVRDTLREPLMLISGGVLIGAQIACSAIPLWIAAHAESGASTLMLIRLSAFLPLFFAAWRISAVITRVEKRHA